MVFNEIYGCYYNAVAKMISLAIDGELTEENMYDIARKYCFEESALTIIPAIKNEEWKVINRELETPILNKPVLPVTEIEKRWLKTILMDKRIKLFKLDNDRLIDVEPLYLPEDVVYFDKYADGDPYDNEEYIKIFRTILQAIKLKKKVDIEYAPAKGDMIKARMIPIRIEYSDKEDKFRVVTAFNNMRKFNIARITRCELTDEDVTGISRYENKQKKLVFELTDDKNALERAMRKFARYKKEAEKVDEDKYIINLYYDADDETAVLIEVMSFGPVIRVLEPVSIKREMQKRISKQKRLFAHLFNDR